jgi:hypothetical protein
MQILNTNSGANLGWSTPRPRKKGKIKRHFLTGMILIVIMTGSLAYTLVSLQINLNDSLSTINSQSIPAISTTQQIEKDLETLDGWASDFLAASNLTEKQSCTLVGLNTTSMLTPQVCDAQNIDAETILLNQDLFAATNNKADADQQTLLERISIGLESYLTDIHQMRVDDALSGQNANFHDPHMQQAYQDYDHASKILNDQITLTTLNPQAPAITLPGNQIPFNVSGQSDCSIQGEPFAPDQWMQIGLLQTLDCLNDIDQTSLNAIYTNQALGSASEPAILLFLIFTVLLIFYTINMVKWTHRLINLGLLTATILGITLGFINWNTLLGNSNNAYQQMVENDYATISYTSQLQNTFLDARANESRWQLATLFNDTASAETSNTAWQSDATQIIALQSQVQETNDLPEEDLHLATISDDWSNYLSLNAQIHTIQHPDAAERLKIDQENSTLNGLNGIVAQIIQDEQANYTLMQNSIQESSPLTNLVLFPLTALLAVWGIASSLKHF